MGVINKVLIKLIYVCENVPEKVDVDLAIISLWKNIVLYTYQKVLG